MKHETEKKSNESVASSGDKRNAHRHQVPSMKSEEIQDQKRKKMGLLCVFFKEVTDILCNSRRLRGKWLRF